MSYKFAYKIYGLVSNRGHVVAITLYGLCEGTVLLGYYPRSRKGSVGRPLSRAEFEGKANGKG
jgi:hypothetical protein